MTKQDFDAQKDMFESLRFGSPKERNAITKAIRLNREGLQFVEQGQKLHAQIRFSFVEQVGEAIRSDNYEDFRLAVDYLLFRELEKG